MLSVDFARSRGTCLCLLPDCRPRSLHAPVGFPAATPWHARREARPLAIFKHVLFPHHTL